ncbi:flagellar hook assembly protein FlgD [Sulfuricystis multivorans]|uniref:flagellar hook assembly protein FlgD n=1 Tax=Sulfuricystis multivorans TaxID=2211108 RepID=UPI000F84693F|nr:flagellar hook assembly protein FlgD [Sulfuricystis multivorans]
MSVANTVTSLAEQIYASLNPSRKTDTPTVINEAENRFLTLLTTQLRNQDPLNPLDNAQLTSQLAQISTVNGIEKLNATLQTLLSGLQDTQAMQAALLVNHGVLVPGNDLILGEQGAIGGVELASAAEDVSVTIKDGNGLVVRTLSLGAQEAGINPFVWDGKADNGAQAAPGKYSVSIGAKTGTTNSTPTALAYGLVQGVTRGSNGLTLDVGGFGEFGLADVKQIF